MGGNTHSNEPGPNATPTVTPAAKPEAPVAPSNPAPVAPHVPEPPPAPTPASKPESAPTTASVSAPAAAPTTPPAAPAAAASSTTVASVPSAPAAPATAPLAVAPSVTAAQPVHPAATAPAPVVQLPPPQVEVKTVAVQTAEDATRFKTVYRFSPEERLRFGAYALLSEVIRQAGAYPLPVIADTADRRVIEPLVDQLLLEGLIVRQGTEYVPTDLGRARIRLFNDRFNSVVYEYGAFVYFDTFHNEFAHERWNEFKYDADAWTNFTRDLDPDTGKLRFRNQLVSVFQYENYQNTVNGNPRRIDIKEASFHIVLNEGFFSQELDKHTFELALATGTIFDQIEENLNSQLQLIQFQYQLGAVPISPRAFFDEIIERGRGMVQRILEADEAEAAAAEAAAKATAAPAEQEYEEVVTETVTTTTVVTEDVGYDYGYGYGYVYDPWSVVLYPGYCYEPVVVIDLW